MSKNYNTKNGQYNVYSNHDASNPGKYHEHTWYNYQTGQSGWHGAYADGYTKRVAGQSAGEWATHKTNSNYRQITSF